MKTRTFLLLGALLCTAIRSGFANGGAWQVGVPSTGDGAPSDKARSTEVGIEEENLTIDLHQEFAAIEVRYRMRNAGPRVLQDFFFPVERWSAAEGEGEGDSGKPADLENYRITADNGELKVKTIDLPPPRKAEPTPEPEATPEPAATAATEEPSGEAPAEPTEEQSAADREAYMRSMMEDFGPPTKHWKKSEIPFSPNQTREIVIRYRVGYSGYEHSVSDDANGSDKLLIYSLSPAATWKGAIGRGKITVNVLHPMPEEVSIAQPAERFKKLSEARYVWEFSNLEPTLADDLKIVAHRAYNSYSANNGAGTQEEPPVTREYVIQGGRYYLDYADYDAVASSTLPPSKKGKYGAENLGSMESELPWAEGAEGDGIGESIVLHVKRPLPLEAIRIMPGYFSSGTPALWEKNNRVAELEVTLNGEKTFTAKIPDERFAELYPIPVRDYAEPVKTVKLVIKAVHRGTAARDTCISSIRLRGKLAKKPEIHPAR